MGFIKRDPSSVVDWHFCGHLWALCGRFIRWFTTRATTKFSGNTAASGVRVLHRASPSAAKKAATSAAALKARVFASGSVKSKSSPRAHPPPFRVASPASFNPIIRWVNVKTGRPCGNPTDKREYCRPSGSHPSNEKANIRRKNRGLRAKRAT